MVVPHKRTRSDVLLTRSPLAIREQALYAAVRLACVKHAASVQSEPGSNSSVQSLFFFLIRPFDGPDEKVVLIYSPELKKVLAFFCIPLCVSTRDIFSSPFGIVYLDAHTYRFVFKFLKSFFIALSATRMRTIQKFFSFCKRI